MLFLYREQHNHNNLKYNTRNRIVVLYCFFHLSSQSWKLHLGMQYTVVHLSFHTEVLGVKPTPMFGQMNNIILVLRYKHCK